MEPPAQPAVPPTQIPKSKGGCACCAMGCTSMFVLLLVGLAMIIGLLWWGLGEVVKEYTASGPIAIATETTDAEYAAAEQKYNALAEAARTRQTVTVQLNANEVNALIARHPEFSDMRGKFRVAMADSVMTLEMSVPLREIDLPRIRDRWLNGSARFGLLYHDGNFNFSLRGLSANEREISMHFLENFAGAFNEKFNESFREKRTERDRTHDFWENIKTLAVVENQLVLTTMGPETAEDVELPDEPEATPTPESI